MQPLKRIRALCLCASLAIFGLSEIAAQTTVARVAVTSGGATVVGAGNRISASVAQPVIGKTATATTEGRLGFWYQSVGVLTDVAPLEDATVPGSFRLDQNYPNPFNPSTTIQFALPQQTDVLITLYDLMGREVVVLVDRNMEAGTHKITFDASGLHSGVYFYRLVANGFIKTRKLTLLK